MCSTQRDGVLIKSRHDGVPVAYGEGRPKWKRSDKALWRTPLGDLVVVALETASEPFALSGGARLWTLLAKPRSLDQLAEGLGAVDAVRELLDLLLSMEETGVVERVSS